MRPWVTAAAVSLGAHAVVGLGLVVVGALPGLSPRARPEPPPVRRDVFRVGMLEARPPGGVKEAPAAREAPVKGPRPVARELAGRGVAPAAVPAADEQGELPAGAPPAEGAVAGRAEGNGVEEGAAAAGAMAGSGPGEPAGAAADVDGEARSRLARLVHARLAEAAERCYPPTARRFHVQGTAGVTFCVEAGGAVGGLSLATTSGSAALDRAAKECVVPRAAPFPEAPPGTCFTVPVRFNQP